MITIAGKNLCENCFSEISSEPCSVCGFCGQEQISDPTTLASGSVLQGRYAVGRVIGKGGFGITYLAYDIKHEEKIAIKEYYPYGVALRSPETTVVSVTSEETADVFKKGAEKFYDEARLVAAFNGNPSIVSVYDFFYENDTVYYTMEYLEGMTLKDYVDKNGVITAGQAVLVAERISSALMTAHSSNILHRDISPDNIMICNDGKIKLLDFGAARQVVANASQSLSVILKQGFAPLEQYQKKGRQGPWTDIYSLGATLYYAMTKDIPDDPMSRFEDDAEYSSNKYSIYAPLWEMIRKATMLRIEDRYNNVFEFRAELSSLGIEPEPLVQYEPKPQTILPEGVTAKPYTTLRTSEQIHTQSKIEEPKAEQTETKKAPKNAKSITAVSPKTVKKSSPDTVGKPTSEAKSAAAVTADIPAVPSESDTVAVSEKNSGGKKAPTRKQLIAMLSCAAAMLIIAGVAVAIGTSRNSEPAASVSTSEKVTEETTEKSTGSTKEDIITSETTTLKNYYEGDDDRDGNGNNDNYTTTTAFPIQDKPDDEISKTTTTTTAAKEQEKDYVVIAGKQYKKNMTGTLNVCGADLTNSDIKQMKYLTKLTEIIMSDNPKVTDLSPLSALTGLEKITFHNCNVKDISFTANMKNLSVIGAENNGITDISALKGHKKLTEVWLQSNSIKDISALKDSTNIESIDIKYSPVTDLSALSGMKKLAHLNLYNCSVSSLAPLKKCTTIEYINLDNNNVSDLTPLAKCKGLRELHAANNALNGNVKALKGLTILDYLDLSGNNYDVDELFECVCYAMYSDADDFLYDY